MSNFTYTAADELDRRAANRALKRTVTGAEYLRMRSPEPMSAEGRRLAKLSTDALRAEVAQTPTPTPAPARKAPAKAAAKPAKKAPAKAPVRTLADDLAIAVDGVARTHVEARKAAWQWRLAEFHLGRKHTYAAACAHFGTTPAKAAK